MLVYNEKINTIKNNNINLEREVGGFRFVAEAFNLELNTVVKFFIFLIVFVFDPLAIALVIAFNQMLMGNKKKEDETPKPVEIDNDLLSEMVRVKLSEDELKKLENVLLTKNKPVEEVIVPQEVEEQYIPSSEEEQQNNEILNPPVVEDEKKK
jgi:CBS domain containing-hemolysin-like protein